MHDFVILIVGFILAIIGTFIYDSTRLRTWAASRSQKGTDKRLKQLQKRRALVEKFYNDRIALNSFMTGRLLFAATVWLASATLTCFLSLYSSGAYGLTVLTTKPIAFNNAHEAQAYFEQHMFETRISAALGTTATVLSFGLDFCAFVIAFGGYVVWRRVKGYEKFSTELNAQTETLKSPKG